MLIVLSLRRGRRLSILSKTKTKVKMETKTEMKTIMVMTMTMRRIRKYSEEDV